MSATPAGEPPDRSGCLTADGLAALANAPVGQAPPDLAAHLAGCARCQDRLLFLAAGPRDASSRPTARAPWRNLALVTMALVLIMVVLSVALGMLSGSR